MKRKKMIALAPCNREKIEIKKENNGIHG